MKRNNPRAGLLETDYRTLKAIPADFGRQSSGKTDKHSPALAKTVTSAKAYD
jgi:hypothetical protein